MQDYKKEEPKHLVETARNLAREGIVTEPIEYGMLHVTLGGKGLCWVSESGIGFYKEDISGNDSREVLDRVREIAEVTREYMSALEQSWPGRQPGTVPSSSLGNGQESEPACSRVIP